MADINKDSLRKNMGIKKHRARVSTTEPPNAVKIVNEPFPFDEYNIPMTMIKRTNDCASELKPLEVPTIETCDIKIEKEEVTVPTVEATAIKKEIETLACDDSIEKLEHTTIPSIETRLIKTENETLACKEENISMDPDIKINKPEPIEYSNRMLPNVKLETVTSTDASSMTTLRNETLGCQAEVTPTATAATISPDSRNQHPRTLEFIVLVPYRIQIRDPAI